MTISVQISKGQAALITNMVITSSKTSSYTVQNTLILHLPMYNSSLLWTLRTSNSQDLHSKE